MLAAAVLAGLGPGCAEQRIVAVDPTPCADAGTASCVPVGLLNDVVGYWRLDDPPGSRSARDGSGWGNTGTLVDLDPSTVWVEGGRAGRALSVQRKGFVQVAPSTSIDSITSQVTVAAWIFIEGTAVDFGTAISRQVNTTYEQHYHLSVNADDRAAIYITTPARKTYLQSPTSVPRQTWVHIAGTYDGRMARLYVNGVEVDNAATSGAFTADSTPVILSGNANESTNVVSEFFPGRLDEIMLYRRALGAKEIAQLHAGALAGDPVVQPDGGR